MPTVTCEQAHSIIDCKGDEGKLFWKIRNPETFAPGRIASNRDCAAWNARLAGKEALASINADGYKVGCIYGYPYMAHRIIWLMTEGYMPEEIDHINGIRSDNRRENLREVRHSENMKNRRLQINNTSGYMGVYWVQRSKKWQAQIKIKGKKISLGYFNEKEEAISARAKAEEKFGFHKNHGSVLPSCKKTGIGG